MRDESPSRTAAWVAAARGMAELLPPEARLVDDPYGLAFANLHEQALRMRALAKARPVQSWILYMQVRTRVIDDALRAWVAGGGRQVVMLGAGYDCRALRLPELRVQVRERAAIRIVDEPRLGRQQRAHAARRGDPRCRATGRLFLHLDSLRSQPRGRSTIL